jgi:hypothetical protein
MTQWEIDREVADATGESMADIRRRGFTLWEPRAANSEMEPRPPLVLDWDSGHPRLWTMD